MKKSILALGTLFAATTLLTACSNNNESKDTSSKSTKTEVSKKKTNKAVDKTDKDASNDNWTFKDDTFAAGILTYKITKTEVRNGFDNTKVLVVYMDITNNTDKEQEPSNLGMVLEVSQKTDTAKKELQMGMLESDDNGDEPLKAEQDAYNDTLLGGKNTHAVALYELVNDNPVTMTFKDSDYKTIGTKTIDVK